MRPSEYWKGILLLTEQGSGNKSMPAEQAHGGHHRRKLGERSFALAIVAAIAAEIDSIAGFVMETSPKSCSLPEAESLEIVSV